MRVREVILMRIGGAPQRSCLVWIDAVRKAQKAGLEVPTWAELEELAPSLPIENGT